MKKSNFDILMHRYLTNQVSDYERIKIEAWLNVMKAERDTELELTEEDEERLFQKITSATTKVEDVVALFPHRPKLKLFMANQWVQMAASVVILLSASFAVWFIGFKPDSGAGRVADGNEKLILHDGTLVWLKEGSLFSYYQKEGGIRRAELTGEALFEIAKVPNSTFTITCGSITVKAIGTSFNVKTDQESIELKVLTGKVNLSSIHDSAGVNVAPNEKVVYTSSGDVKRVALMEREKSSITVNTEYNMSFNSMAMDRVIERLEKKFDIKVTVTHKQLKKCRVTADFTDTSLEDSLIMLTDLLDVSYRIGGKHIELSGKGCN
jgi:transmembrane sensor